MVVPSSSSSRRKFFAEDVAFATASFFGSAAFAGAFLVGPKSGSSSSSNNPLESVVVFLADELVSVFLGVPNPNNSSSPASNRDEPDLAGVAAFDSSFLTATDFNEVVEGPNRGSNHLIIRICYYTVAMVKK